MSIKAMIWLALPVTLGAILFVLLEAIILTWWRQRRARRELTRALEQRWTIDQAGKLGNGWEKR